MNVRKSCITCVYMINIEFGSDLDKYNSWLDLSVGSGSLKYSNKNR